MWREAGLAGGPVASHPQDLLGPRSPHVLSCQEMPSPHPELCWGHPALGSLHTPITPSRACSGGRERNRGGSGKCAPFP